MSLQASVMHKIDARLRFLAAGTGEVVRGARPSYRAALVGKECGSGGVEGYR